MNKLIGLIKFYNFNMRVDNRLINNNLFQFFRSLYKTKGTSIVEAILNAMDP